MQKKGENILGINQKKVIMKLSTAINFNFNQLIFKDNKESIVMDVKGNDINIKFICVRIILNR